MYSIDDTATVAADPGPLPAPRNRYRVAAERLGDAAERRRLEQDLRNALAHDQLLLHYQPRLDLASGAIAGAEALIRWPHRKRGLLAPADFMPTAKRSSMVVRIGGWVLRSACCEAAGWAGEGIVSVNVAARQLADGALLSQVSEALDLSGLAPERLELDLTEAMLLEADVEIMLMLSAIRDLGVGIALDDFGTGHASLAILRRAPLTVLKLDRSVVRDLPHFREEANVAEAVVDIAHALAMTVTAEGIETAHQRDFLAGIGCDHGQGFLFDQALPAAQFRDRLAAAEPQAQLSSAA